ncbi:dienelactone hydrolase family protein [Oleiagrimonas sp. MCCC 1A03011]|uniref:dienelactone hydrolase family protein n=1 Tax=Oleiagrimonas sp. MCCC 1A03011 TaxID=1926883 RepID=UPI000DC21D9D|nr:dienelactone hydrolase family protein [Oleiagrimonas sp. MCCC 1A03011]RAP58355.1 carboxymethylenebutenolidase [Oleiagrimonas sp. MCCC 1A03011]
MAEKIRLQDGPPAVNAWMAQSEGAPKGGVVVIQEIFGVTAHIRRVVDDYAQAGYTAIAPAIFDLVEPDVELAYDEDGVKRGLEFVGQISFEAALDLVKAAADRVAQVGKVGVVGYCWGGTVAYLSALRLGLPAVSYYGGRNTQFVEEEAQAPLMFHYGERDAHISAADRDRVRKANPDAEFHVYPADHGFNCNDRGSYDEISAALARKRTLAFFAQHLA